MYTLSVTSLPRGTVSCIAVIPSGPKNFPTCELFDKNLMHPAFAVSTAPMPGKPPPIFWPPHDPSDVSYSEIVKMSSVIGSHVAALI